MQRNTAQNFIIKASLVALLSGKALSEEPDASVPPYKDNTTPQEKACTSLPSLPMPSYLDFIAEYGGAIEGVVVLPQKIDSNVTWGAVISVLADAVTMLMAGFALWSAKESEKRQEGIRAKVKNLLTDASESEKRQEGIRAKVKNLLTDASESEKRQEEIRAKVKNLLTDASESEKRQEEIRAKTKKLIQEHEDRAQEAQKSAESIENVTYLSEQASYVMEYNTTIAPAITKWNRTLKSLERKEEKSNRIGAFPEAFPYMTEAILSTENLAILAIPFSLLGVLVSPIRQKEFRHTLHDLFDEAVGGDGEKLVIITYEDDIRQEKAFDRYSEAKEVPPLLYQRVLTKDFLENVLDKDIAQILGDKIKKFRKELNPDDKKQIKKLVDGQKKSAEDEGAFLAGLYEQSKTLKTPNRYERAHRLFKRVVKVRAALKEAMRDQEGRHFKQEEENWKNVTFIKLPREANINNKITLCVDGKEIVVCHASMEKSGDRPNKVESKIGYEQMVEYKKGLNKIFDEVRAQYPAEIKMVNNKLEHLIKMHHHRGYKIQQQATKQVKKLNPF